MDNNKANIDDSIDNNVILNILELCLFICRLLLMCKIINIRTVKVLNLSVTGLY